MSPSYHESYLFNLLLLATRLSSNLKTTFGISVSQIELLGSMTIGMLDELVAKSKSSGDEGEAAIAVDDGSARYGEPIVPILNDMLAYDEPYTTDASAHQYRIWLAQASLPISSRGPITNFT